MSVRTGALPNDEMSKLTFFTHLGPNAVVDATMLLLNDSLRDCAIDFVRKVPE